MDEGLSAQCRRRVCPRRSKPGSPSPETALTCSVPPDRWSCSAPAIACQSPRHHALELRRTLPHSRAWAGCTGCLLPGPSCTPRQDCRRQRRQRQAAGCSDSPPTPCRRIPAKSSAEFRLRRRRRCCSSTRRSLPPPPGAAVTVAWRTTSGVGAGIYRGGFSRYGRQGVGGESDIRAASRCRRCRRLSCRGLDGPGERHPVQPAQARLWGSVRRNSTAWCVAGSALRREPGSGDVGWMPGLDLVGKLTYHTDRPSSTFLGAALRQERHHRVGRSGSRERLRAK